MATWPPRLSTAAMTRSTPIASASERAKTTSTAPLRNRAELALQLTDADAAGVEDRRREARVRVSPREDLAEVFDRAGAAGGDDGDVDRIRNSSGHLAVEARERPVPIHGGEKDLARAARFGFARPLDRVACRIGRAAANVHRKSVPSTLRIDRDDDGLAAVAAGERRDQP